MVLDGKSCSPAEGELFWKPCFIPPWAFLEAVGALTVIQDAGRQHSLPCSPYLHCQGENCHWFMESRPSLGTFLACWKHLVLVLSAAKNLTDPGKAAHSLLPAEAFLSKVRKLYNYVFIARIQSCFRQQPVSNLTDHFITLAAPFIAAPFLLCFPTIQCHYSRIF